MDGKTVGALVLFAFLVAAPASAQDAVRPTEKPWPGMSAYDVVVCARLVLTAGFVERRVPGAAVETLWVTDARGWKKENGFYGIKINGSIEDEATIFVFYRDRMTNLQALFTYSGSETDRSLVFQDEFR